MVVRFFTAVLSRLFPSDRQTQQALQWWHQRQVARLHDRAEYIREGLLQDLFALRRTLELALQDGRPVAQEHLQQLERVHRMLEGVSNELSPPFIQDSLPLALQQVLQEWGDRHPHVHPSLHLPCCWDDRDINLHRIVLTALEELLHLLSPCLQPASALEVDLSSSQDSAQLRIQVNAWDQPHARTKMNDGDLQHLRRAFETLTAGRWHQSVEGDCITWQWSWTVHQKHSSNR